MNREQLTGGPWVLSEDVPCRDRAYPPIDEKFVEKSVFFYFSYIFLQFRLSAETKRRKKEIWMFPKNCLQHIPFIWDHKQASRPNILTKGAFFIDHISVKDGIFLFWGAFMKILGAIIKNTSLVRTFGLEAFLWSKMKDIYCRQLLRTFWFLSFSVLSMQTI